MLKTLKSALSLTFVKTVRDNAFNKRAIGSKYEDALFISNLFIIDSFKTI